MYHVNLIQPTSLFEKNLLLKENCCHERLRLVLNVRNVVLSKFMHCFSAHVQAVSFASAVQPLFLLPPGIFNSYAVSPQQW